VTKIFFLATLGSEPQVVTLALQLLAQKGVEIAEARVIHTAPRSPAIARALADLEGAFKTPPLSRYHLSFELLASPEGLPLSDITTAQEAEATFRAIFGLVRRLKQQGATIHFCVAGGRKIMALYGLAVAQLLFDGRDGLYLLVSEPDFLAERRMLLQPGDPVRLLPVPFIPWTSDAALLADILRYENPLDALRRGGELQRQMERQRKAVFCEHVLTRAEEEVVALLVREGLTNEEIGERLGRSAKTVANQLSSAYAKLADYMAWYDRRVDRHALIAWLHDYYAA